jgi:hypothetical protein
MKVGAGIRNLCSYWLRDALQSTIKNLFFFMLSRLALGPTLLPIQWVKGDLSSGVKWPENEADHSPPTNGSIYPLPHTS